MARFGKWILGLCTSVIVLALSHPAFAQTAEAAAGRGARDGLMALAAGIGVGLAACGGAIGQARAAAAALDGIGRNPGASQKIFVPMMLGLAFIESLIIFTWVMAFILSGKIGG